jgi:hypothetical protein
MNASKKQNVDITSFVGFLAKSPLSKNETNICIYYWDIFVFIEANDCTVKIEK